MDYLLIVVLILLVLMCIFLIFFFVYFKNKLTVKKDVQNFDLIEEKLKNALIIELGNIKENLNTKLLAIQKEVSESSKVQSKDLEDFKEKSQKSINESYTKLLGLVNEQLSQINHKVDEKLSQGFKDNKDSLLQVKESLGKISEAQKNLDLLSNEVTSLNNVLTNSQKRGRFGEVVLESILNEVFGDTINTYSTQYVMKNNESLRPDAVIFLPNDKLLCIDSKFSFVDYEKLFDQKNSDDELTNSLIKSLKAKLRDQVKKIHDSYIVIGETCEYAIMFIPNDGIYAYIQTVNELYDGVIQYARNLNVIISSPSTLQPILANLRTLKLNYQISENIGKVVKEIKKLSEINKTFNDRWNSLSSAIDTLSKKRDNLNITVNKISKKTSSIINQASKDNIIDEASLIMTSNDQKEIDDILSDESE